MKNVKIRNIHTKRVDTLIRMEKINYQYGYRGYNRYVGVLESGARFPCRTIDDFWMNWERY